ncbi:hypothetical protein [Tetragenococcus koreensis]|uniref:DUF2187 domain-containing protein n=1 Tax=Tetragenococcus koreensis TaxID=290335 RepID=A0AAN4UAW9_9ENTE|nr:hypothetical protein [Tetragenococcus koreensis]AYW46188.1 hypothetical protein C7K43_09785 [Tetragenococcus koreensis]MCF1617248.1 hypothetical protein [Tetragenococcus koreensis]MCF1622077.1 hypothetical protein [Tetragenococcus koreensis]MCF1627344.1 hypothetical protein [Tetragenococcus koreensis]MCF1632322.1 hypothetical protein [Tetragenococcus koreensis]
MATFGKFDTSIDPSEVGKEFTVDEHVAFEVHNQSETGTITKQLKNSALIKIDETSSNQDLIGQTNGVIIINYKQMKPTE